MTPEYDTPVMADSRAPSYINRRGAMAALLGLLCGGLIVATAPMHLGELRIGGVSVLWWYTTLIAPLSAAAVALLGFVRRTR